MSKENIMLTVITEEIIEDKKKTPAPDEKIHPYLCITDGCE